MVATPVRPRAQYALAMPWNALPGVLVERYAAVYGAMDNGDTSLGEPVTEFSRLLLGTYVLLKMMLKVVGESAAAEKMV